MATFVDRVIRTAKLDAAAYEEVESDATANGQAVGVVVLSALAAGIGTGAGLGGLVVGVLVSLAAWYVWTFLTYWIGTRLLPEPQTNASHGEVLRAIGFASGPGVIRVLGVVPPLRGWVFLIAAVWMLVAGVVGVRQALDYRSTWRAVGVVAIGWIVQWLLVAVVLTVLGPRAW
ncbi:MAG: YIP1 family protein [Candidatus Rokuibacteriota bacterium]